MNKRWKDLTVSARQTVMQEFMVHNQAKEWIEQFPAISLRQLYCYVQNPEVADSEKIKSALRQDEDIYKRYCAILDSLGACVMISTKTPESPNILIQGHSPTESDQHWRYRLELSPASPDKYFLLINTASGSMSPTRLCAQSAHGGCVDLPLNEAHQGVIHMVFHNTHPLIGILQDENPEVRLLPSQLRRTSLLPGTAAPRR
jgi:hypothetical protein